MTFLAAVSSVVAVVAVWMLLAERRRNRRALADTAVRLGLSPNTDSLAALGREVERRNRSYEQCRRELQILDLALGRVDVGVRVVDVDQAEIAVNALAAEVKEGRHGLILLRAASDLLCEAALAGHSGFEDVQIVGPPRRTFHVAASPVFVDGDVVGAVVVYSDTSNDERIERVRRDFVANLSHELKTPVAAIGLLAETLEGEPDEAVRSRLMKSISAESDRVALIIDDLLDLSRLEFERDLRKENVAVAAVMSEAIDRVSLRAESRDIQIATTGDCTLNLPGDRDLLVHAVANLLDNAIKYSPESSCVEVGCSKVDHDIELFVRDSGIGIPNDDLERIFERFYRVDRARSRATGGTGLGLSIVRHIAANHGGTVRVESIEGVGSTFTIAVPDEVVDGDG